MKIFPVILLVLLFPAIVKAQTSERDSLLNILSSAAPDTVKGDALNELAFYYYDYNVDSAYLFAKRSEELAIRIGNERLRSRSLKNIGICYDIKGKTDSAVYFLTQALDIARKNNYHPSQSNILTDIGNAYFAAGNYELALRNHFEALRIREQIKDKKEIPKSYNNIALVYRARKDLANAVHYNLLSLEIKKQQDNKQGVVNSYINLGSCYQFMGKYDSSLYYAQQVMKLAFVPQDIREGKVNYANALRGLKKYAEADKLLLELLPEMDPDLEQNGIISCYEGLGIIKKETGRIEEALDWFQKGLAFARHYDSRESVAFFYRHIADCYELKKDFTDAYRYLQDYQSLEDSLLNEENIRQMNEMNAVYQKDKQQEQIGALTDKVSTTEEKVQQGKKERNLLLLAAIFLLALLVTAFLAWRYIRRKNLLLAQQKVLIETSLKEKEVLMREIHHRVKNNLQVVTSLLNLQSHYIQDEKAYSAVQAGRNRVQSMALIHQFLYSEASKLTSIQIKDYITELLQYIDDTNSKDGMEVSIVPSVDDIELDIDMVVPVGLIINELVTNAYKYAFAGKAKGIIRVSFKRQAGGDGFLLRVADDGVGMNEEALSGKGNSFGYRMIKAFVEKLGATLQTGTDNGTTVSINIPASTI